MLSRLFNEGKVFEALTRDLEADGKIRWDFFEDRPEFERALAEGKTVINRLVAKVIGSWDSALCVTELDK